jgi:uncharacterized RDD family membrane protein YckC
VDPFARLRSVGDRLAPPAEALAQRVAERVVDLVLSALDVNALLDRVDVDALLDRVDVDALLDRVDVDRLLARVDMDGLLAQTDLGAVIARSSGGVAGNALDVVRSQAVGLDEFTARWAGRLRHRPYRGPPGPPARAGGRGEVTTARASGPAAGAPAAASASLQGHYAGFASRFAAYIVDAGTSTGIFMLALAAISFAVSVVTGTSVEWTKNDTWAGLAYVAWLFIYFAYSWAASGKTFGMAVLGVRVVRADGADAGARRAALRTLALPLSFLLFGLGFLGILLGRERRALHDVIAGTAVIYSWDARAARLRFLSRASSAPAGGSPAGAAPAMTSSGQPRAEPGSPGLVPLAGKGPTPLLNCTDGPAGPPAAG